MAAAQMRVSARDIQPYRRFQGRRSLEGVCLGRGLASDQGPRVGWSMPILQTHLAVNTYRSGGQHGVIIPRVIE